jgi:hypothetical protein
MNAPTTTIQVSVEIRDRLRELGRMGESYDAVIRRLLEAARATGALSETPRAEPLSRPSRLWRPLRDRE